VFLPVLINPFLPLFSLGKKIEILLVSESNSGSLK